MKPRIPNWPVIPSSEITPESLWLRRRDFMKVAAAGAIVGGLPSPAAGATVPVDFRRGSCDGCATDEAATPFDDVTSYNNFYEFGTDKDDPAKHAHALTTDPWSIEVTGHVNKPGKLNLEDVLTGFDLE